MNCDSSLFAVPPDEDLCQTIFDSLPVAVLVANLDGGNYFVNRRAASMTGYSTEELMKGVWMVHPEDTEALGICHRALHEGTPGSNYETRLVRKDGSVFWTAISWNPIKDTAGKVTGLCTVFADISDKKDTQHALHDASERYKLLAEHASDMFFVWDTNGIISFASPSVRQLGYVPEELLGTNIFDLVHPDDKEQSHDRRGEHLRARKPQRYQVRFVTSTGAVKWVEAQIDLLMEGGEPAKIHAIIRDISQRKRAEEELRQASERYRMLVDHASDIFTEWDPEGNVVYASPAIRQLGFTPAEVVGRNVFTMVPPEDRATSEGRLRKLLEDHQPLRHELRVVAKDGSIRWLEAQVDIVVEDYAPARVYAIHRDITERKHAEDEIRRAHERYRALAENATDILLEWDIDRTISYVSPSVRQLGYKPEELVGKTTESFVDPQDLPHLLDMAERQLIDLEPRCEEVNLIASDGSLIPYEIQIDMILEDGLPVRKHAVARNISERRAAEQALRESEQRYKNIVENTNEMIMLTTPEGKIVYASPASVRINGYTPEEMIRDNPWVVHPEDTDRMRAIFLDARKGVPESGIEYRIITKSGEVRWVSHSWAPMREGERVETVVSVVRDVTERKRAEEALQLAQRALEESERKYKGIVENSTDMIMLTAPDGTPLYASPAALDITGYDFQELVEERPWIVHPDDSEWVWEVFQVAQQGTQGPDLEYRIITRSGETRWVSQKWAPIYVDGELQSLLSVIRDVTERKESEAALRQAQDALRDSEQRYKGIVENSNDLILVNNPDGVIEYASPAVRDMLGYEPEELIGTKPNIMHPEDHERVQESFARATTGASESNFEYRLFTKEGGVKWVSHSWSPIYADDRLQRIISSVRDITERKKSEEQLRRAHEELEQAYMLQREFLNNVTHEVRTPLTAVQGYTEMLMEGIAGPVSDEQAALLQKIISSSEHLLDVLNAVLQIARMKSGRIALRPRVADPRLIVEKCLTAVVPQARKKGISINLTPNPDGTVATYDGEKLTIIVTNLLGNAVKFTTSGSVDVSVAALPDGCEVTVTDTGIGIADSALDTIFDEFSQLEYPGKHKPSGFGLGLAIVAAMVDTIGGTLTVSSEKGLGTSFTLWSPALEAEIS